MTDKDFISLAKNTAQIFKQGMNQEWLQKLKAVCVNVKSNPDPIWKFFWYNNKLCRQMCLNRLF